MSKIAVAVVAAMALTGTACSKERSAAAGPPVSRDISVSAFNEIAMAGPFNVSVATGKPASVRVTGPAELLERMEIKVDGDTLVIRQKRGNWFGNGWDGPPASVMVTVPSLTRVESAGSGDVTIDRVQGDKFEGGVAGSGDLVIQAVAVGDLKLGVAGSGNVRAAGQARWAEFGVAGSGDLDASALTAERAKAGVAGSGDIRANVTGEVEAGIAGSGDITITGGAKCKASKAGSGEIRCS